MRWFVAAIMALSVVYACVADTGDEPPVHIDTSFVLGSPTSAPTVLPTLDPAADLLPAADPKLFGFEGWALSFDARRHAPGTVCRVELHRGEGSVATLEGNLGDEQCIASWDGRDAEGVVVDPGSVDVSAVLETDTGRELARAHVTIEVVRLGIDRIQLSGTRRSDRVPLLYRAMHGVREGFYEVPAGRRPWALGPDESEGPDAVGLELEDGTPRSLPPPWDQLTSPPLDGTSLDGVEADTMNLPTAFVAGSHVVATATLSADLAGDPGGGEPILMEVRVIAPESTRFAPDVDPSFVHGAQITTVTRDSPVPAVGRYDLTLDWAFEARQMGGDWVRIPGALETRHRLYGLVGLPVFDHEDIPHRAWVDVVDTVAGWVDGATADPIEVGARIVEGVYYELGLRYDNRSGASAYTDYPFGSWEGARFDLSWFQDRAFGEVVNCSDAASIVSTFANMVGIDFRYHILTHRTSSTFDLNYIQPIGFSEFSNTPFTSGRGAFRYHAVVGPEDGTFFDATLALDGDDEPTSLPTALLLAQGLVPVEYLRALSTEFESIRTRVDEKVRVR
jgi:hypothetical protein